MKGKFMVIGKRVIGWHENERGDSVFRDEAQARECARHVVETSGDTEEIYVVEVKAVAKRAVSID